MSERLRVAIVGPYPGITGASAGGVASVAYALANGLADRDDVEVHVVTTLPELAKPVDRTNSSGVHVCYLPRFQKLGCLTGFAVDRTRIAHAIGKIKPDIVHVQGMGMYAFAALERGRPSVMTIHGVGFREGEFLSGYEACRWKLGDRYDYNAAKRAKHIICLNKYGYSSFSPWFNRPVVKYIENPIDDAFFDTPLKEEPMRILVPAVVRRLKGIEYAIRAVRSLRDAGFTLDMRCVGPLADKHYFAELRALVVVGELGDMVSFEHHVDKKGMIDHYARCSLVVLPSLVESAPMVVSEAMAAGKAIIATSVGGVPEMLDSGHTGMVVPPKDHTPIARAIEHLLDRDTRRRLMGREARQVAEMRHRQSVVVDKTLEFYREILSSRGR